MPKLPKHVRLDGGWYWYRRQVAGLRTSIRLSRFADEARTKAKRLDVEYDAGRVPEIGAPSTGITVREFSARWVTERIEPVRRDGGALVRQRLRDHILPVVGDLPLATIGRGDLMALRASLGARLSPQSVVHVLSDLRCLLRYALEVEAVDRIPSWVRVMPRLEERAPEHLSDDQVAEILRAVRREAHREAILLGLLTGLRWGELQSLTWHRVNADHLTVQRSKSGKPRRVPLVPDALGLLQEMRIRRPRAVRVLEVGRKPGTWVARIGERVNRERAAAGLAPGFTWHFHQLRHTFAYRWLRAGGSKEALRMILGHSTIRLTERYGRLSDAFASSEAARISFPVGTNGLGWRGGRSK